MKDSPSDPMIDTTVVKSQARDIRLTAARIERRLTELPGGPYMTWHSHLAVQVRRDLSEIRAILDALFARVGKADR